MRWNPLYWDCGNCGPNESEISWRFTGFRMQAAIEPTLDESHIPIDRCLRCVHQRRGFFGGTAKKIPQFHKLDLVCVDGIQLVQCPIEFKQVLAANVHPREIVAQRHVNASTSAHLSLISPGMIDQDSAHHLGGECIKMPPVVICDLLLIQEFQVELMHEGRRA